jgi:hypothetical protein
MSAGSSHLVENPYAEGNLQRQAIGKGCFDFLKKLPDSFGGATNFLRAPWPLAEQRRTEKNCTAMVDAMVEEIDGSYRHSRRGRFSRMKSSSARKKSGGCDG